MIAKRCRPRTEAELRGRERARQRRIQAKFLTSVQNSINVWNAFMDEGLPMRPSASPFWVPVPLPTVLHRGEPVSVEDLLQLPELMGPGAELTLGCPKAPPRDDLASLSQAVDEDAGCFGGSDAFDGGGSGLQLEHDEESAYLEEDDAAVAAQVSSGSLRCPCGCGGISARVLNAVERNYGTSSNEGEPRSAEEGTAEAGVIEQAFTARPRLQEPSRITRFGEVTLVPKHEIERLRRKRIEETERQNQLHAEAVASQQRKRPKRQHTKIHEENRDRESGDGLYKCPKCFFMNLYVDRACNKLECGSCHINFCIVCFKPASQSCRCIVAAWAR